MPGPSNPKKKRKTPAKASKGRSSARPPFEISENSKPSSTPPTQHGHNLPPLDTPPPTPPLHIDERPPPVSEDRYEELGAMHSAGSVLRQPVIYDPGNGPRVRDIDAFLASKYFPQPPAFDNSLCAEFAQEEVLQMLMTVLPEETAMTLWYNKSRETSRICPACRRLYRLGDILRDHMEEERPLQDRPPPPPQLRREQELSGLCSPVCFILASFNYPGVIKAAWGRTADEMDDDTWDMLNAPPQNNTQSNTGLSLGMLMKMTRLHDLGLAQLCLGLGTDELDPGDCFDDDFGFVRPGP